VSSDRDRAGRKLFVYVGHEGKHLLRHVKVRKFKYFDQDPARWTGSDLVLFQSSFDLGFVNGAGRIPESAWSWVRRGVGKVVFDASREARPHHPEESEALHRFLRTVGAPLEQAIYVTQDRQYGPAYQAYCAGAGVPKPMKVVNYDYWIRRFLRSYEDDGRTVFEQRLAAFRSRPERRERRFLSLNLTARQCKVLFLLSLMRDGLWDAGFISFGGFGRMASRKQRSFDRFIRELGARGFADLAEGLAPLLPSLDGRGEIILGRTREAPGIENEWCDDEALEEYSSSWFSAVTETEMRDQPCRITEKPLKAMVNFHPPVVFGNPGSLQMLRKLGFETFPELIDESYDEEPDPRRRFDMAYDQVRRLCRMDEVELARLMAGASEKLVFNAEHGLTRLPLIYREQIDEALMAAILAPPGSDAGLDALL
jgi:hypothetical protein